MQISKWTTPALLGAGAGAAALAIVGFNWGGWMTSSSAQELSAKASRTAVTSALVPYCIQKSKSDPQADNVFAKLKAANSFQRQSIIEKTGWATPPGADKPNVFLAQACQVELIKTM